MKKKGMNVKCLQTDIGNQKVSSLLQGKLKHAYAGREWIFDCKLYLYPKFTKYILLFVGSQTVGTFIQSYFVVLCSQFPNFQNKLMEIGSGKFVYKNCVYT